MHELVIQYGGEVCVVVARAVQGGFIQIGGRATVNRQYSLHIGKRT